MGLLYCIVVFFGFFLVLFCILVFFGVGGVGFFYLGCWFFFGVVFYMGNEVIIKEEYKKNKFKYIIQKKIY
jgi:hypothetical protein